MSLDKHCCVPGCKESGGMHSVLHGFPNPEKDRERFNKWLYSIGGDILRLQNSHIFKYRRVCRLHFEDKYICRNNRISNIAVPTLCLPGLNLLSPPKLSSVGRNTLQGIVNQPIPSTSTAPESHQLQFMYTSTNVVEDAINTTQKENIDPDTLMHERIRPLMNPAEVKKSNIPDFGEKTVVRKTTNKVFLTNVEKELRQKLVAAKIKLSKIKNKVRKQSAHIRAAKKVATNPAVLNVLENCTSTAKLLMGIQIREDRKQKKGRRFSLKEKIAALSIFKQSPKGYRFLRKVFILPAQQTLIKLIQMSNLKPGINKNIFSQLKTKAELMKLEEKLCIIMFDEVSLKANLSYQERKGKIVGLVDNGQERQHNFADHAQVFMVRGLIHNYKQALSYTFASSATKGPELAKQIKEVVTQLQEAGLIVVASVCDQGTNNRQALKLLLNETKGVYLRKGEEPKENLILINGQEIVPLYDPPHLLKGIRNNLLNKNLQYTTKEGVTKTAKWSHIKLLYEENPGYKGLRLIPKLTENHVNPEKNKMKVKFASQIFSRTVASNMGYLADKNILPKECKETADLLLFMDNIFDSVNGSQTKNRNAKPLLGPARPNSVHHQMWVEGIKLFKTMKFINPNGKAEIVPSITNWVWTLTGINILLNKLKNDFNVSSVWMRHLNQDPLENFFGAVRSQGCRNTNPTCDQFESTFATLLINNLSSVHTRGNCESDFCDALYALIINENVEPTSTCSFDFGKILNINFTPLEEKERDPRIIAPIQYISGYFLKKIKTRIYKSCIDCTNDLTSMNEIEYIKYREYAGRRWLCTPSQKLVQIISNMQDVLNEIIKENIENCNLREIIKTAMILLVDFDFKCNVHKDKLIDYLIAIVIRCIIFNYCKNINKILAGKKQVDDDEDTLQTKAKKLNKCYKRHK